MYIFFLLDLVLKTLSNAEKILIFKEIMLICISHTKSCVFLEQGWKKLSEAATISLRALHVGRCR